MKRRGVFGILVAILVCYTAVFAQDANFYKQQIEACLSRGDCDKAQTMYDSWKELSGARDTNIESRIATCREIKKWQETQRKQQQQTHPTAPVIGQEYAIRKDGYFIKGRVAYLDATKLHGLLLVEKSTRTEAIRKRVALHDTQPHHRLPTKVELELIYKNNYLLGLHDEYWSQTADGKHHHYTLDFSNGKTHSRRTDNANGWGEPNYYYCHKLYIADF